MEGVEKIYNEIAKSPRDDRQYRGLQLKNNMKVLVICDPSTDKAAAAMDVHIGKVICRALKSQILKFRKSEMLAGDCAKGASVYVLSLWRRRRAILGGSGGMVARRIFEICTSQIAGNAPSGPPVWFFHAAC